MTFSEWMSQNGYNEYNSASGRRLLQLQYGITGDSYTANMALWDKLKKEKQAQDRRSSNIPMTSKALLVTVTPTEGIDAGPLNWRQKVTTTAPTEINIPTEYLDRFYDQETDNYYGGSVGSVEVIGNKHAANVIPQDERNEEFNNWLKEASNDPHVLFHPNRAKYRSYISKENWNRIMAKHPDWWTESTKKYIPEHAQAVAMKTDVRKAMNDAAPYAATAVIGAFNPFAAFAANLGGIATNLIVDAASDGKYTTWGQMLNGELFNGNAGDFGKVALEYTNPGAWAMGGLASGTTGGVTTRSVKLEANGNLASGAGRGITNVPYNPYPRYQFRTTTLYNVPATRGAGLGRGFRGGPAGKGLNPRGNAITSVEAVPMQLESPTPLSTQFNVYGVKPFAWLPITDSPSKGGQPVIPPTPTPPPTPFTPIPIPQIYNTAYSWGHPDFVNWWMENNTPENQGKVLWYPGGDGKGGRWIVIRGGGSPVLEGNYDGSIPTGVYQRESGVGAYEVQNQTPMPYDGTPIKGTEVYFTPAGQAQDPYELGEYQVFKKGGKVNYLLYIH